MSRLVVGYARCSTHVQEQSVGDQLAAIERWAREKGSELVETFTDDGVSGGDLERPGLLSMLGYVEAHPEGGTVVLWDLARLARADDPLDGMLLERRVARAGWTLHYLHGTARTGDALADGLVGFVGHHAAGQYRRSLALSTTRGAASSMADGKSWRGPTPYGYAKRVRWADGREQVIPRGLRVPTRDAVEVRLVPGDAREVEVLRSIFEDYAAGRGGVPTIAARLASSGAPAPGPLWRVSTVQDLLCNPVFAGDVVWNRKTYGGLVGYRDGQAQPNSARGRVKVNDPADWIVTRDAHEALVPRELWERTQAVREGRGQERGAARRTDRYPLSGLLTCGACGGPFVMRNIRRYKKGKAPSETRQARYICAGSDATRACRMNSIHEDVIEDAVREALGGVLGRFRASPRLRAEVLKVLARVTAKPGVDLSKLTREEADLAQRIGRAVALLSEVDTETAKELAGKVRGWRTRVAAIQSEKGKPAGGSGPTPSTMANDVLALVDDFHGLPTASRPVRRRFYTAVLERVVLRHETRQVGKRVRHVPVGGEANLKGSLVVLCEHPANGACTSTSRQVVKLALPSNVLSARPMRRAAGGGR